MKPIFAIGAVVFVMAFNAIQLVASVGPKLTGGETEVLYEFPPEAAPEGIALDRNGNTFVSVRTWDSGAYIANELFKITPWGEVSVLTDLGPAAPGGSGILGLTTDPRGNVYAAFVSDDCETHGVWKIYPDGETEHLPGSENIIEPNALTLDKQGNLYVTDSDTSGQGNTGVWRLGKDTGVFEPWCGDPLLLEDPANPNGDMPLAAANGIAFDPPNHLYVANTEKSLIAHVPILKDGSAGQASLVARGALLFNPDGLAVDTKGNVYAVIPISTVDLPPAMGGPLPPLSPVVKVYPKTGLIEPVLNVFSFPDGAYFDFPTSLAFGTGPLDKKSVFIVSMGAGNFGFPPGSGPKLTQVGVGVPGQTGQ